MSISTSTSGYSSESQWDPVTRNTNSQNETRFLVTEAQPYRLNPVNYNGAREQCIYSAPKLPNVNNVNCINSNIYFNPPNYVNTGAPNGLIRQEMRFQKSFHGFHNTSTVPNPRSGHIVASLNTWGNLQASGDRMISRPMNVCKPASGGVKKPKRIRTAFTSQQMMELENEYARTRYLDRSRRIELSEVLHLNERTIKIWFQNRRMKEKKDRAESLEDTEATSTTETCSENGPVQMIVYDPYPHNGMGRLGGGDYADHFQPVSAPVVAQNVTASMTTGCHDVNCYPSFVLDNTSHLLQSFQQDSNPLPVHCQQLKQEYPIDSSKNTLNDFKEEIIENSPEPTEKSTNDASQNDEEQNWDLSWIRSIHIEDELQE